MRHIGKYELIREKASLIKQMRTTKAHNAQTVVRFRDVHVMYLASCIQNFKPLVSRHVCVVPSGKRS